MHNDDDMTAEKLMRKAMMANCAREHANAVKWVRKARLYKWCNPAFFGAMTICSAVNFLNETVLWLSALYLVTTLGSAGLTVWLRLVWSQSEREWALCAEWWLEARSNLLDS